MEFQNLPIHLPGCHINQVTVVGQIIYIQATTEDREAKCPICCSVSNRIHGYYCRKLTDLPISECQVIIHLKVRRYSCINQECRRKTFSQPLGQLFQSHQRATFRLHRALYHIAQFLGGQAGARLASKLNMPTSGRTLLRIVRQYPLALEVMPRIVGVDDWAMRRGHTYGTILVDLESHRVIDLLPGRSASGLANWLTQQSDITIVARDRSKEYAAGIVTGAPNAIQIADRWHLLKNLRDTVDSSLNELYPHLKKRLNTHAHEDTPGKPALRSAFLRGKPDKLAHQARRIQQMKRYELVQYLKQGGLASGTYQPC